MKFDQYAGDIYGKIRIKDAVHHIYTSDLLKPGKIHYNHNKLLLKYIAPTFPELWLINFD
jgi:hypothetical protein